MLKKKILCTACEKIVSDNDKICPHCGKDFDLRPFLGLCDQCGGLGTRKEGYPIGTSGFEDGKTRFVKCTFCDGTGRKYGQFQI